MDKNEFDKIASAAINAANQVLFDAGVKDKFISQLGFSETSLLKTGIANTDVQALVPSEFWSCGCWDCTGGPGPCQCNGPACDMFLTDDGK